MNLRYFFYFFALLLYVSTALNSYGFDDEFFNIGIIIHHVVDIYGKIPCIKPNPGTRM